MFKVRVSRPLWNRACQHINIKVYASLSVKFDVYSRGKVRNFPVNESLSSFSAQIHTISKDCTPQSLWIWPGSKVLTPWDHIQRERECQSVAGVSACAFEVSHMHTRSPKCRPVSLLRNITRSHGRGHYCHPGLSMGWQQVLWRTKWWIFQALRATWSVSQLCSSAPQQGGGHGQYVRGGVAVKQVGAGFGPRTCSLLGPDREEEKFLSHIIS